MLSSRLLIPRRLAALALIATLWFLPQIAAAHEGLAEQIAALSAQIARDGQNAALLVRRAELYRVARQWALARADLDRATTIDPAPGAIDLARAHLSLDTDDDRRANDAASHFLTVQPDHLDALLVRARARTRLGQVREAGIDFSRALALRPTPDVYIERARAVLGAGPGNIDTALRGLDEGIQRLGPIVTIELEAADLEVRARRYDAALSRLDRVSSQAARKESWLARRGAILEKAGRRDAARTSYRDALAAATSLPERVQRTRATAALIEQLRTDLDRLEPTAHSVNTPRR